jgi:hypothetical protein
MAEKNEVLGENLPQCQFVHHKPHMLCPDANPGRRSGKPMTYCLNYGSPSSDVYIVCSRVLRYWNS